MRCWLRNHLDVPDALPERDLAHLEDVTVLLRECQLRSA
jgi:hypothetical protein